MTVIIDLTVMFCTMYPVPFGRGLIPPPLTAGFEGWIAATSNVSRGC